MSGHDLQHCEQTPPTMSRRTRQVPEQLAQDAPEPRRREVRVSLAQGHPEIDRWGFELTKIAVAKIDRDPSLLQIRFEDVERWTRQKNGHLPACHAEWEALIARRPRAMIRTLLTKDSDDGQRLRSSRPFIGSSFVSDEERAAIRAT